MYRCSDGWRCPEFWTLVYNCCVSNDTAKGHPEERAGKPHTQVETIIPRNVEVQTAIHMQLGFSNSGEDLDWRSSFWAEEGPQRPTENWNPLPHTQFRHREPKLYLSVYIQMTLCYTCVFISMTIFPGVSSPGKWLDWSLQDFPKDSSTLQWKATQFAP